MKTRTLAWLLGLTMTLPLATPARAEPLKDLAKTLREGAPAGDASRIAVLDFLYEDGACPAGCTVVRERLTTYLAAQPGMVLVERSLLDSVAKEIQLEASGIVAPEGAPRLGELSGADAAVAGTLHDLPNNRTEVNARLIHIQSGRVLAAGQAVLKRTWPEHRDITPASSTVTEAPRSNVPAAPAAVTPRRRQSPIPQLLRTPPELEEHQLRFFIGER